MAHHRGDGPADVGENGVVQVVLEAAPVDSFRGGGLLGLRVFVHIQGNVPWLQGLRLLLLAFNSRLCACCCRHSQVGEAKEAEQALAPPVNVLPALYDLQPRLREGGGEKGGCASLQAEQRRSCGAHAHDARIFPASKS